MFLAACAAPSSDSTSSGDSPAGPPANNSTPVAQDGSHPTTPAYDLEKSSIQNGDVVYELSSVACSTCHGSSGTGVTGSGASLIGVNFASIRGAIDTPPAGMPKYTLSDLQVTAVVDYVGSLTNP